MRKRVRRSEAHSRRKESTLNFWLWRGHGFEKYNVKALFFFFPSIFLFSDSLASAPACCMSRSAMYFTLPFFFLCCCSILISNCWLTFFFSLLRYSFHTRSGSDTYRWEELLVSVLILFGFHFVPSHSAPLRHISSASRFFTIKEILCEVLVH